MQTTPCPPTIPSIGGIVEPANRAAVAKERFQTPKTGPREHYELRDPFAEVTYRANTFPEIVPRPTTRQQPLLRRGRGRQAHGDPESQWRVATWQATARARVDHRRRAAPEEKSPAAVQRGAKATSPTAQRTAAAIPAQIDARAERAALVARLEAALEERYIIRRAPVTVGDVTFGRTEYRFRGDTSRVAFTESTFRLATDTNSPSVARSMVDVAEARNWRALRVSGNEDFKRMVWLEASVRGVKTLGYEPNPADLELLKREREARLVNRIEPARDAIGSAASAAGREASARGGGGARPCSPPSRRCSSPSGAREAARGGDGGRATEKLAQRIRNGQAPKVKVYDKAAPSQRPAVSADAGNQRSRDRAAPAPVR